MIKQILFASAAFSAALGATLFATGPALAQMTDATSATAQLTASMRSVSLVEAMADPEIRAELGLIDQPVHTVLATSQTSADAAGSFAASLTQSPSAQSVPGPRLAMLNGFSTDEQRLGDIMIGNGIDIVRQRRTNSLAGLVSDNHDFGNIGFSEVDSVYTDPSPSRIGIRFSF